MYPGVGFRFGRESWLSPTPQKKNKQPVEAKLYGQRIDGQLERAWEEQRKERELRWAQHQHQKQELRQKIKDLHRIGRISSCSPPKQPRGVCLQAFRALPPPQQRKSSFSPVSLSVPKRVQPCVFLCCGLGGGGNYIG